MLNVPENRWIRKSYNMLLYYSNIDNVNWATHVKNILCRAGFIDVWLNQGVGDCDLFLKMLYQRLKDMNIQEWRAQCYDNAKLGYYYDFKAVYGCEYYRPEC